MRDVEGTAVPASFWVNAVRRNVALILVCGLIGTLLGLGYAIQRGGQYVSESAILIAPLEGNPYEPDSRGDDLGNMETEATLAHIDPVARIVKRRLGSDQSVKSLLQRVEVEVPPNTQVLQFTATAGSRVAARDLAQAFAESYLLYRKQRAQHVIDLELQRVEEERAGVQSQINEAAAELASEDLSASRRSYLEERLNSLGAQLANLESQESTLQATDLNPGQVITSATLPDAGGPFLLIVLTGAGGFAGLILGLMIAVGRTRLDTRVHEPPDVERFGVPVLGSVQQRFGSRPTGTGRAPDLPETYREIRTAIVTSLDSPPVGLTIAASDTDVSAAPEAAALAAGLARAGFTVALVDTVGEATKMVSDRTGLPGLADLLAEQADLQSVLIHPEERLTVLPLGAGGRQTMDRLLSPRMRSSLAQLSEWNDYVLIAGSQARSADGQALASLTGAVLLVVARHHTRLNDFIEWVDVLDRVDAACVGAVLVDGPRRRKRPAAASVEPPPPPPPANGRARGGYRDRLEAGTGGPVGERASLEHGRRRTGPLRPGEPSVPEATPGYVSPGRRSRTTAPRSGDVAGDDLP